MSALQDLKACTSLPDVARLLHFKPKTLAYVLYRMPDPIKYNTFEIPKRSGGTRTIAAPCDQLKRVQRNLATVLQDCLDEINAARLRSDLDPKPDRIAHGFKRRRSIITNAIPHRGQAFVFNVDIADYFGSINFGRVRGFLLKDSNFALPAPVATVLAQIACFKGALPQGSPCSPVFSNLIGHILDIHLARLAKEVGITYTRYADDLTFSTNKAHFPHQIAQPVVPQAHYWQVGAKLHHLVDMCGFQLNAAKTRMQYAASRQMVTGLVVNRKINAPVEYRRTVRAMLHSYVCKGSFEIATQTVAKDGKTTETRAAGTADQLRGMLEFAVYASRRGRVPEAPIPLNSPEVLYRTFLLFHDFFSASKPLVVCEGKTDVVYLAHAVRSLAKGYPQLASIDGAGKVTLAFRRHRYPTKTRGHLTARLLSLHGGTSHLKEFVNDCFDEYKRFHRLSSPSGVSPVILLLDDDDGSKPMKAYVKQRFKVDTEVAAASHHLFGNVYLVLTPTAGGHSSSKMEDLFDSKALAIQLDGKSFDPNNDLDTKTSYGKARFAYEVVAKQADTINFDGFRPLLDRVVSAITSYEKLSGSPT